MNGHSLEQQQAKPFPSFSWVVQASDQQPSTHGATTHPRNPCLQMVRCLRRTRAPHRTGGRRCAKALSSRRISALRPSPLRAVHDDATVVHCKAAAYSTAFPLSH